MSRISLRLPLFVLSAALWLPACVTAGDLVSPSPEVSFEKDIRPIFKAACFQCHGEGGEREGGLDVRLVRTMLAGGDSGPALVAGDGEASLLLQRIVNGEMPPDSAHRLSRNQVETVRRWIDAGAPTLGPEPDSLQNMQITDAERSHWSFQPISRPAVPSVADPSRVRTPIDAFLLRKLEQEGFGFSRDADKGRLLRRASIALLGTPPTPEQIERFVQDEHPAAYQRQLDQLLASPAYGERWGRHWLDVAGYADSEGYNIADARRTGAWRYRDYVVAAWNEDKPFDRFVVEQLAGDELISSPLNNLTPDDAQLLIATGFLRMAPDGSGGSVPDANVARNDVVAATMQIVSSSLLGLTVACAQCHDHRYDPIAQSDYYRLRAVFDPALDWKNWRSPAQRLVSLYTDQDREAAASIEQQAKAIDKQRNEKQAAYIAATLEKQIEKLPEEIREAARTAKQTPVDQQTDDQKKLIKENPSLNVTAGSLYLYDRKAADELKALGEKAAGLRATKPPEGRVRALTEVPGKIPESFLFARGDHSQPQQQVTPAGLTVVSLNAEVPDIPINDSSLPSSGRRLALAGRLTDRNHPLLARVIVNRIWMHHFGRGLVSTPSDFGALGARPTHPELLDWLAAEWIDSGWSIKHLHGLIMKSTAYRQALRVDRAQDEADPENLLYGGARLRRLDAETLRDTLLEVCGNLNREIGGPPVPVMADAVGRWVLGIENIKDGRAGTVLDLKGQQFRRSIYAEVRRSRPLSILQSFDWPAMAPNCEKRNDSTVATQSLMLMNSDFVVACADALASRILREVDKDESRQIDRLWKIVYGRRPDEHETGRAQRFVAQQTEHFQQQRKSLDEEARNKLPAPEQTALATLAQMLLSSNEFLYVD